MNSGVVDEVRKSCVRLINNFEFGYFSVSNFGMSPHPDFVRPQPQFVHHNLSLCVHNLSLCSFIKNPWSVPYLWLCFYNH